MTSRRRSNLIIEEPVDDMDPGKLAGITEWLRSPAARVGAATLGAAYLTAALSGVALAGGAGTNHGPTPPPSDHGGSNDQSGNVHAQQLTAADQQDRGHTSTTDQHGPTGKDADTNGDVQSNNHNGHGEDNPHPQPQPQDNSHPQPQDNAQDQHQQAQNNHPQPPPDNDQHPQPPADNDQHQVQAAEVAGVQVQAQDNHQDQHAQVQDNQQDQVQGSDDHGNVKQAEQVNIVAPCLPGYVARDPDSNGDLHSDNHNGHGEDANKPEQAQNANNADNCEVAGVQADNSPA